MKVAAHLFIILVMFGDSKRLLERPRMNSPSRGGARSFGVGPNGNQCKMSESRVEYEFCILLHFENE